MKRIIAHCLFTVFIGNLWAMQISVTTCETAQKPLVVSRANPRLGWTLKSGKAGDIQTAYEIVVASSHANLVKGHGDMWQSGKVVSAQSQWVVYKGIPLQGGTRYYWKVRVWDAKGKQTAWSKPDFFDMGLLTSDQWQSQWIGAVRKADSGLPEGRNNHIWGLPKSQRALWDSVAPLAKRSIMLRKDFEIDKPVQRAVVYISGLGHYELTLNSVKVGDSEFAPLWTDYDKTVYYNAYDLTAQMNRGAHAIGVLLGNGMYNVTGNRYVKFWGSFGPPTLKLLMVIEFTDGSQKTVATDRTWKYAESPITFNCMYGGESYDATLEQAGWDKPGFDQSAWKDVVIQEGPKGTLTGQLAPPVKVMSQFEVKKVVNAVPGRILLDMGQNLSGFPVVKLRGEKGQKVKLWVGEQLSGDTVVSQKQSGGPHYYEYTLKGVGEEEWHPRFSYYGFQYVQIEGANYGHCPEQVGLPLLTDIKSCFVHSSAAEIGRFESSNALFNKVHWLINNAVKSNMQSVFTDCPHREKLGWLEETHLVGPGIIYNYSVANLLGKTQHDMMDAQLPNGLIPSIAPEYVEFSDGYRDSPEWGGSVVINPWMLYEFYGDDSYIVNSYAAMKRYFDYLITKADSGILSHGLGDWYDFGEHRAGPSKNTPIALSATAYFYHMAVLMGKSAAMVGQHNDELFFAQWAQTIRTAFNEKFFNPETKQYGTGSQAGNAMALCFDLVDDNDKKAVVENLVSDIRNRGNRLTSGDVGNRYLFRALALNGQNEVMFDMNNHYEVPGYGFQIQFGVTTLTENWDPRNGASWNHFMMGQIEEWFFRSLAGINPDMANPGFKHFFVEPAFVGNMEWVKASTQSIYGTIESAWERKGDVVRLNVGVPVNTKATLVLYGIDESSVTLNGKSVWRSNAAKVVRDGSKLMVTVGSGKYELAGRSIEN